MTRSAPSRMPRYQSGWLAEEIASGLYGPYSQIGLICATVASTASAPKMKKNHAVPLIRKNGQNGWPITVRSELPRAGIAVCFWRKVKKTCTVTSARISPGMIRTCRMYIRGTMSTPG